ncbi:tryptophan synthase subunit alpha [Streptomyces sp. NPDC051644]|uniref:tryptophan synthase subunit alpha n=1 Tax=Streptomyces sp. NPDC051644 TaxID=3365666 RepID=UPI0037A31535
MHEIVPAAAQLTTRLAQSPPALSVYLPAGFPAPGLDVETLQMLAAAGADVLEIGLPHPHAPLDGPAITEANRRSLVEHGTRTEHVFTTVRRTAETTQATVLVMTYWEPVRAYEPRRFALELAAAGAAGALIPDLPPTEAAAWRAAVQEAGLHNLQFTPRQATDSELAQLTSTATGWLYAPAVTGRTGYQGQLDIAALKTFTRRLERLSDVPVVTGVGVSTPELAEQVAPHVAGVVVGSPIVRCLLRRPDRTGAAAAADTAALFADSIRTPALT